MPQQTGPQSNQGLIGKGIKAGLNFATIGGDDTGEVDTRIAFAVGGFLVYGMGSMSVQMEGFLSQKGYLIPTPESGDITAAYTYLEVPVSLRFDIATGGQMTPYLFGGGALAVLVTAEASLAGESVDIEDTSPIDAGVVVGAGLQMPAGAGQFIGEVRYTYGLLTIDASDNEFEAYNRVLTLLAGYSF